MSPDRLVGDPRREIPTFRVENIYVAGNRGPCGGVWKMFRQLDVALDELAGIAPLWTNWYPVNNIPVTEDYEKRGLRNFKNDWSLVPRRSFVMPSAHGVGPDFYEMARRNECIVVADGTCQLVTRVHMLVKRAEREGKFIIYIGKSGHPETVGVMSEVDPENIMLVEEEDNIDDLNFPDRPKIVYSQTTLSTKEVASKYKALKDKFGDFIEIPPRWDICEATDTRQRAVEELVKRVQLLVIVGSGPSHNSNELRMIGEKAGIPSHLVDLPEQVDPKWFTAEVVDVGGSSGASVPDYLMFPVIDRIAELNPQSKIIQEPQVVEEDLALVFKYDELAIREVIRQNLAA